MGEVVLEVCGLVPAEGDETLRLLDGCLRKVGMEDEGVVVCEGSLVSV